MSAPLRSRLAVAGDEFRENAAAMGALADEVRALHDDVLAGGGAEYVERHRSRGNCSCANAWRRWSTPAHRCSS